MTPYELGRALWRQRLLAALVVMVTAAALVAGVALAPKTYVATGRMTVSPAATGPEQVGEADLDVVRGTLAGLADSRVVAEAVAADLADDSAVRRTPEELRRSVSGEWIEGTSLVEVVAQDGDPDVAALVAQETLDALQVDVPVVEDVAFTVTTSPRPPVTFSSPDLLLTGGAGLLVALVLATLAAVVRDRRRATVDDGRVAEDAAGAPLLAHVWPPEDLTALPALHPGTIASDGFRHLRRAVLADSGSESVDLVVVGGVGGGETHVWVGANLAISLASAGHEVLLVDGRVADQAAYDGRGGRASRRGAVGHTGADLPGTLGLVEVMAGAPLRDAASPGPVAGLDVLPAHRGGADRASLGVGAAFSTVMEQARGLYDVVVVIPPPLQGSDDARILAAGGSMLLAVPEASVSVASLHRYADRVRAAGAHLLGVVLVGPRGQEAR